MLSKCTTHMQNRDTCRPASNVVCSLSRHDNCEPSWVGLLQNEARHRLSARFTQIVPLVTPMIKCAITILDVAYVDPLSTSPVCLLRACLCACCVCCLGLSPVVPGMPRQDWEVRKDMLPICASSSPRIPHARDGIHCAITSQPRGLHIAGCAC